MVFVQHYLQADNVRRVDSAELDSKRVVPGNEGTGCGPERIG